MPPVLKWALVQSVNDYVGLPSIVLNEKTEQSVGKNLVTWVLMTVGAGFIKRPGCLREILVVFTELPH